MFELKWGDSASIYFVSSLVVFLSISLWFYYRTRYYSKVFPVFARRILWVSRFLSLGLLGLLLFGPVVEYVKEVVLPPKCVVLLDNSKSIAYEGYSSEALYSRADRAADMMQKEGWAAEVKLFDAALCEGDSFTMKGAKTNLEAALNELQLQQNSEDLREVIVFTDGVINDGSKSFVKSDLGVKTSFVCLGDTGEQVDLHVKGFYANNVVYKGDFFQIKSSAYASRLRGKKVKLKLWIDDSLISTRDFRVDRDQRYLEWDHQYKSDSIGVLNLKVTGEVVGYDEKLVKNNELSRLVSVKEKREQ